MTTQPEDASMRDRVFEIVRAELLRVRRVQAPHFAADIRMESSLVADLGLDSLSLLEAVVALEQALRIDHLSLEALNDGESDRDGGRFTVESLVNLCIEHAAANA
jgi:acyl carrier protein